jgi:hypothetical protein
LGKLEVYDGFENGVTGVPEYFKRHQTFTHYSNTPARQYSGLK